jgi:DNA-directed RNA polymerase specialized sigma24 family protein
MDIAWDIVLVAVNRTFEYMLTASAKGIEVVSLKSLSITIARNYFQDRRRKDQRLQRLEFYLETEHGFAGEAVDFVEVVHDQLYKSWLFGKMARIVDGFAPKTRLALLIHVADKLEKDGAFDGEPTQLELAFIDQGMYLREYRYSLQQASDRERASISSLASYGYRRLANELREMLETAEKRERRGRKETDGVH